MSSQSSSLVKIPASYLEKGIDYNFTVSYINFLGTTLTSSLKVSTGSDLIPSLDIDGGEIQYVKRSDPIKLRVVGSYSGCFDANRTLVIEWDQFDGPPLNIKNFVTQNMPLWATIPKCVLKPDSIYTFLVMAYIEGYARFPAFLTFSVITER